MKMLRHGLAVAVIVSILYITSFISIGSRSRYTVTKEDINVLQSLQKDFTHCVEKNGMGMHVEATDFCSVRLSFANDTEAKWKDPKTGELEPLQYDFNLCEALSLWEQVRNSSTILTKEYIDFLPNGWEDYAWRRINKGITLNKCANKTLCMEKLSLVLPKLPPFVPRQYGRCAVVGNSGDLLKTRLGQEIDSFDAVIRGNGAPTENYTEYVGKKRTFRLLNRGSAKALDKVAAMDDTKKEVLIIKTTIHDTMSKMIKEVPIANSVYLMLGTSLGSSAKGTGIKALEFALSICETVDIYGFTVDPGYTEWSRYFSESRGGHTPLLGRAYYQMMECLGLIRIHSPMRLARDKKLKEVPKKSTIESARRASERVLGKAAFGKGDPLAGCVIWAKRKEGHFHNLVYLREPARNHHRLLNGVTQYPLEHSSANGLLCVKPLREEEMMSK